MDSNYKNLIWTNHALRRMRERGIVQSDAYAAWRNPDRSKYAKNKAAWVYYKDLNSKNIEVVVKKNEKGEWVILSVWSKTPSSDKTGKENKSLLTILVKKILGR